MAQPLTALEKTWVKPANPDGAWDRREPVIPADFLDRVTVAVFVCTDRHKTKATNLQKESGITCSTCRKPARVMPQFA